MQSRRALSIGLVVIAVGAAGVVGLMIYSQGQATQRETDSLNAAHDYRRTLARQLSNDPDWGRVGLTLNNPEREGESANLVIDGRVPTQAALDRLKSHLEKSKSPVPVKFDVRVAPSAGA